ncbi:MAG: PAC2 family protein [Thaumarchaeota archaeon]|jgi:predicted ATP-grasp superfamily ATP-dependent carboligase|nr:PAC2 family protein [Nitrososphaerota archaeon]
MSSHRAREDNVVLVELDKAVDLTGAHVIDATPSAGIAPSIALSYMIDGLKPVKIAEVKSRYFPHVSLVSNGIASQPKIELYKYESGGVRLVLISRNFAMEDGESSYLIAEKIYRFLVERNARNYYLLTGIRLTGSRGVYVASADPDGVREFVKAGAKILRSLDEVPADKLSSHLMHLYLKGTGRVWLLAAEVMPYFPDPAAAKDLLELLSKVLRFEIDLTRLEEEIRRQREIIEEFRRDYEKMLQDRVKGDKEPHYIG